MMKKRLEKLEAKAPEVDPEEQRLKELYDGYRKAETDAERLYYREQCNLSGGRMPEWANREVWRRFVRANWRQPKELQRLRNEYQQHNNQ